MCILQIRGERPFLSKKFDIEGHHNYKYLSDHDNTRHLDVKAFLDATNNTDISQQELDKDDWVEISPTALKQASKNSNKKENVK